MGVTQRSRGAENGFKNCRKKFCEDCENFKSIGTGVEKLLKIYYGGGNHPPPQMALTVNRAYVSVNILCLTVGEYRIFNRVDGIGGARARWDLFVVGAEILNTSLGP